MTSRTVVLGRYERLCSDEVDDGVMPEAFQLPDVTRLNSACIGQVKQFRRRLITDPFSVYIKRLFDIGHNLELDRRDAIILRHHLFLYTKDHPGFFSDEGILKIREISNQIDKQIENNE